MLENGMIVGAERYDVQQREPKSVKCICCKDTVPEYECHEFFDGWVCGDCLRDYCEEQIGG